MKNIKKIELVIWLMLCLQVTSMYAGQESKQEFEQERKELIYNTVVHYPFLTKTFNFLHEQKNLDQTFHDFLEQNLSHDENEEDNFEQVIGQAEDLIAEHMKDTFIATLQQSIKDKKSLDQFENPLFRYVMHYKDSSMKDMVRQWMYEFSTTTDMKSKTPLHRIVFVDNTKVASMLIDAGVYLNSKDMYGKTPLHYAVHAYNMKIAKMLIDADAHLNSIDNEGKTPLHYAIEDYNIEQDYSMKIAKMLIDAGANINSKDYEGKTPLHYAIDNYNIKIAQMLIDAGADKAIENNQNQTPLQVNYKDNMTPLHHAVYYNDNDIVSMLIDAGIDLNRKDKSGNTPLHYAVESYNMKIAEMLIEAGAKITIKNNQKQTPLHIAQTDEMRSILKNEINKSTEACTIS